MSQLHRHRPIHHDRRLQDQSHRHRLGHALRRSATRRPRVVGAQPTAAAVRDPDGIGGGARRARIDPARRTVALVAELADVQLDQTSLLWRWAGDMRIAFEGGTAGMLQTMHPAIGHALIDHSNFFDDPVDRVFRSLPGILGTVYNGPQAHATGIRVRDYHRQIKGVMPNGARYHALDPQTFWWAHATF